MKALNNIKFISDATTQFNSWLNMIDSAADYEKAKSAGNAALGFVDCMIVYLNTMICKDNNGFTEELDEMVESWQAEIYQHMADKAISTHQDNNTVLYLLRMRDAHSA